MARATDAQLAYALLRFSFGINLTMHGVSRILSGVAEFASKTAAEFTHTVLPSAVVWPFSAALPIVELIVGALLMFGAYTRIALVGGSLLMAALAFGTALRADWSVLGTQLVYCIAYYVLLLRRGDNWLSIDALRSSTVLAERAERLRSSARATPSTR